MAEELRLALILLGSLAIGAVVLHGIWTVRKNVQEQRPADINKEEIGDEHTDEDDQDIRTLKIKQMEMDFNTLTIDDDSAGLPVVDMDVDSIYHHNETNELQSDQAPLTSAEVIEPVLSSDDDLPTFTALDTPLHQELEQSLASQSLVSNDPHFESNVEVHAQPQERELYESKAQGPFNKSQAASSTPNAQTSHAQTSEKPAVNQPSKPARDPEVLILFVDKPKGEMIDGARLLPLLLTLGFKFGEMDFFHRHEQTSGHGEILFSLANMYNPGTFDIDHMEQVQTRGLSIFMTMPNAGEALQTFNMMHNAAKKIADEFDARVLDYKREPLDVVRVRHYVEKIRKF